jgi:transcriptional regulator with XRE-family HTH domain
MGSDFAIIVIYVMLWTIVLLTMAYYKRLRDLREDHDLTQRQIAAFLGMPQPQYFRYEQGYRDIPTDVLIALADYYNISTDYILGRTNNRKWTSSHCKK